MKKKTVTAGFALMCFAASFSLAEASARLKFKIETPENASAASLLGLDKNRPEAEVFDVLPSFRGKADVPAEARWRLSASCAKDTAVLVVDIPRGLSQNLCAEGVFGDGEDSVAIEVDSAETSIHEGKVAVAVAVNSGKRTAAVTLKLEMLDGEGKVSSSAQKKVKVSPPRAAGTPSSAVRASRQAETKAALSNLRAQAEIDSDGGSYEGVCKTTGAKSILKKVGKHTCVDEPELWAAEAKIEGGWWCVDSTGFGGNSNGGVLKKKTNQCVAA